jgi:hypothetical protein
VKRSLQVKSGMMFSTKRTHMLQSMYTLCCKGGGISCSGGGGGGGGGGEIAESRACHVSERLRKNTLLNENGPKKRKEMQNFALFFAHAPFARRRGGDGVMATGVMVRRCAHEQAESSSFSRRRIAGRNGIC